MTNFLKDSLLYLYAAALFLSAALLFLVQPMVAKMILPFLGGSSAVWITCLFFFQSPVGIPLRALRELMARGEKT